MRLNRLTRLTHAKSGNTLADFQYQFNAVSGITQMIDGAGTHNYTYDTRDRLTIATHPNQTNESYTLDDVATARLRIRVRATAISLSIDW